MEYFTENGNVNRQRGFTLIELLVVLMIIGLLLTIAYPHYFGSLDRAKEAALHQDLAVMRDALNKYYSDTGKYPDTLDDLVKKNYLLSLPPDPLTDSNTTWVIVPPADPTKGGVYNVKSGAPGQAKNGSSYAEW